VDVTQFDRGRNSKRSYLPLDNKEVSKRRIKRVSEIVRYGCSMTEVAMIKSIARGSISEYLQSTKVLGTLAVKG
jgi:hypothetical protein